MNAAVALFSLLLPILALAEDQVNVTVYYESLCPDSQRYFNNQLYPTFITPLVSYMRLILVPYGNANTTSTGIVCQHGPVECYGNRVHACTIDKEPSVDKQIGFINCLMKMALDNKPSNESTYKEFITKCGNWTDMFSMIETCADSMEMSNPLIYRYGNMTHNAKPPIKGVPTTFFNDESSKDINDAAVKDLKSELCKYISGKKKPMECNSGNSGAGIVGSLALILPALLLSRLH